MPLYKEWSNAQYSLAAIWKIEEPEDFFKDHTGLDTEIKSEKRRLEFLAGRFLLKHLEEDFPLMNIKPDEHDKPRIDNNEYYFSISHSWPYVAAVISPHGEVGIDIQAWHPRMEQLQHKFLSADEQELTNNNTELITLAWCAKEAAYKWQGRRGVEFIDHMPITFFSGKERIFNINIYLKLSVPTRMLTLEGFMDKEFACVYVTDSQEWAIY